MEDLEPQDADEADEQEAEIMRADHAFATESVGTTAEEALEGETLDQRLAEETAGAARNRGGPIGHRRRVL